MFVSRPSVVFSPTTSKHSIGRRLRRWSWMPSGWTGTATFGSGDGGTSILTIGVPDDFYAVRVAIPNVATTPWAITKVIASASAAYGDYINPRDSAGNLLGNSAWVPLTFANAGADDDRVVTIAGAATAITVAGNATDGASGETTNAKWTFTDWVPLSSIGADPTTGMRVLMLRGLIPSNQTVTYLNNRYDEWRGVASVNHGFDVFVGGIKFDYDRVTNPSQTWSDDPKTLYDNAPMLGTAFGLVQVMTKNAGIVGMVTGDSHHAGASTSAQINNFLAQSLLPIGRSLVGSVPVGMVSVANGGLGSYQFFPRMSALLNAVRPSFVILPGWTANEVYGAHNADAVANSIFFSRLLKAADEVRLNGAVPIFMTPLPRDAAFMSSDRVAAWRALRAAIVDIGECGEIVSDPLPGLGNRNASLFDGTYDPLQAVTTDGIHPNDAGHAVAAASLSEIVKVICDLR